MLKNSLKGIAILVILATAATILERWYNIFWLGRLYESVGIGVALLGFSVPVVTSAAAIYGIVKFIRA